MVGVELFLKISKRLPVLQATLKPSDLYIYPLIITELLFSFIFSCWMFNKIHLILKSSTSTAPSTRIFVCFLIVIKLQEKTKSWGRRRKSPINSNNGYRRCKKPSRKEKKSKGVRFIGLSRPDYTSICLLLIISFLRWCQVKSKSSVKPRNKKIHILSNI